MKVFITSFLLLLCLNTQAQFSLSSNQWTMFVVINDSTKEVGKEESANYFVINKDWSMCSWISKDKRFDYLISEKITRSYQDYKLLLKDPNNDEYILYLSIAKGSAIFIFEVEKDTFMIRFENLKVID